MCEKKRSTLDNRKAFFRHHAMRLMKPGAEISGGPQEGSLKGFLVTTVVRDVCVSIQIHSEPSKSEGYRLTCNLFMYPAPRRRWHKQKGPGDCSLMSWERNVGEVKRNIDLFIYFNLATT